MSKAHGTAGTRTMATPGIAPRFQLSAVYNEKGREPRISGDDHAVAGLNQSRCGGQTPYHRPAPVCGRPWKPTQEVCSPRCRAKRHRLRQAAKVREVRELLAPRRRTEPADRLVPS
jgi:predicted nucleic acid-binding Zn ribbon protein